MHASNTVPALLALRGRPRPYPARIEPAANAVVVDGRRYAAADLDWDPPDVRCGTPAYGGDDGLADLGTVAVHQHGGGPLRDGGGHEREC